jgi:hypothetical protein
MPIYSFKHKETGEVVDKVMKISERETFLADNPDYKQFIKKAPSLGDSARLGITKTDNEFNSLLKTMKKHNRGSTIKTR